MAQETKIEYLDSGYLRVIYFGDYNLEKVKRIYQTIIEQCEHYHTQKVLIDLTNMAGDIPIFDRYQIAEFITFFRDMHIKMAYYVIKEQTVPDKFFENVAKNLGMVIKVTLDKEEALKWLFEPG